MYTCCLRVFERETVNNRVVCEHCSNPIESIGLHFDQVLGRPYCLARRWGRRDADQCRQGCTLCPQPYPELHLLKQKGHLKTSLSVRKSLKTNKLGQFKFDSTIAAIFGRNWHTVYTYKSYKRQTRYTRQWCQRSCIESS